MSWQCTRTDRHAKQLKKYTSPKTNNHITNTQHGMRERRPGHLMTTRSELQVPTALSSGEEQESHFF
jgi:hypothetical protein